MVLIAPSILSADFLNLGTEIDSLHKASADQIHIDVMDGHFVPNLTMGPMIVRAVKKVSHIPLDVHLMISNASLQMQSYIDAGADMITIHAESVAHLERHIKEIKKHNVKAGVALNPATSPQVLDYIIDELDVILVMSVNPGFGGQQFLPSAVKKISVIKNMLERAGNQKCLLSVDGGINAETAKSCVAAGANCLVAGSYIFSSRNYAEAIKSLRNQD